MLTKKTIILLSILSVLIISSIYIIESISYQNSASSYLISREIDTPVRLWLNGYFSPLLRFKKFNNFSWIILPGILFYIICKNRKIKKHHVALLFLLLAGQIIISLKGYANYRYSFTLNPVYTVIALILIWKLISQQTFLTKIKVYIVILFLVFVNMSVYYNQWGGYIKHQYKLNSNNVPNKIIQFLNDRKNQNFNLITCNDVTLYYFTDYKCFSIGRNNMPNELNELLNNYTSIKESGELSDILINKYNIKYLIINKELTELPENFINFINRNSEKIVEDRKYYLFRIATN